MAKIIHTEQCTQIQNRSYNFFLLDNIQTWSHQLTEVISSITDTIIQSILDTVKNSNILQNKTVKGHIYANNFTRNAKHLKKKQHINVNSNGLQLLVQTGHTGALIFSVKFNSRLEFFNISWEVKAAISSNRSNHNIIYTIQSS